MITYEPKQAWKFLCVVTGSAIPKACAWAFPFALLSVLVRALDPFDQSSEKPFAPVESMAWNVVCGAMSFLLVFRTGQSYNRFVEGGKCLMKARGQWFQSISSIFAFCTTDSSKLAERDQWQELIGRLMSMLYASALHKVSTVKNGDFSILDPGSFDEEALNYVKDRKLRCEIVMQWVQLTYVEGINKGIVTAAPPLVSRAFQELSNGMVTMNEAEKISEIQFPMPYAQIMWILLVIYSSAAPLFLAAYTDHLRCFGYSFVSILLYWGIHYVAIELEAPFGDDHNHLPLFAMQDEFNERLEALLDMRTIQLPRMKHPYLPQHGLKAPDEETCVSDHSKGTSRPHGRVPQWSTATGRSRRRKLRPFRELMAKVEPSRAVAKPRLEEARQASGLAARSKEADLEVGEEAGKEPAQSLASGPTGESRVPLSPSLLPPHIEEPSSSGSAASARHQGQSSERESSEPRGSTRASASQRRRPSADPSGSKGPTDLIGTRTETATEAA
mmetsp:Transcript_50989/g.110634  ORF Transcript_50989/g.110634 Transcript_50989/m.110634 type:complete len:501 (+) Transcript_50989:88-1590(+)|eukprot:CAMPEP_0170597966 /NCGR_PEP_ID=MMETSP0224-20130122/15991_1 /TAXON_ID=285029 /ORGANISM="Togula jolla, Strain CCCM 725" /LENGTH=500 /DNA_ID=CAMNT_0010922477 /DNA_START=88 /DNA_END=1590 /DNA_ORIENTATION=+